MLEEEELGVQLFERHARGSTPTAVAAVLRERAEFMLRYVEQMREDITATRRDPRGPVTLGLSPGLALTLVAPLVRCLYLEVVPVES